MCSLRALCLSVPPPRRGREPLLLRHPQVALKAAPRPVRPASAPTPPTLPREPWLPQARVASVQIQTLISEQAKAEQVPQSSDSLFAYLIERVRDNLHLVLCLSPVGTSFR